MMIDSTQTPDPRWLTGIHFTSGATIAVQASNCRRYSSKSKIEAARATERSDAVEAFFNQDGGNVLDVDPGFYSFPRETAPPRIERPGCPIQLKAPNSKRPSSREAPNFNVQPRPVECSHSFALVRHRSSPKKLRAGLEIQEKLTPHTCAGVYVSWK